MEYCISTWDPDRKGVIEEPHHNTYDIEFWGPNGMCMSYYLGALVAAIHMGKDVGENVTPYEELLVKCREFTEAELFNGEYFFHKVQWEGLRAKCFLDTPTGRPENSPEAIELYRKEGPKYQAGNGCLADGVVGAWLAEVCGLGPVLDREKVISHLLAVHKYNLKHDLSEHVNPQRTTYACGAEGAMLLCTWPHGDAPTLPFEYCHEVWTSYEYHVASYLMLMGHVEEGLEIVRVARDRYEGTIRNPFNDYECGHWYAWAMDSYALIESLAGARYDAVTRTLYVAPRLKGDFRAFLCTATGYGTVGVKDGKPFVEVKSGRIDVARTEYTPCARES